MSEKNRKRPVGSQPLTRHPLFPAIVALWFGALFGLGSLAIRPALIEEMVIAGGIDSVIPMAAPPLGVTTRILLALAMTGLGGLIGALVARLISKPTTEKRERRRAPGVKAAQDAETVGTAVALSPRRRSLAIAEDNGPSDQCDAAPVPGHSARILDVAEFELEGFEHLDDIEPVAADRASAEPVYAEEPQTVAETYTPREPAFLAGTDTMIPSGEAFDQDADSYEPGRVPEGAQEFMPIAEKPESEPNDFATSFDAVEREAEESEAYEPRQAIDLTRDSESEWSVDESDRQMFAPASSASEGEYGDEADFEEIAPSSTADERLPLNNKLFEAYSREISARADRAGDAEAKPLFARPETSTETGELPQVLPRLALGDWDDSEPDEANEAPEHHEPLFPLRSVPQGVHAEPRFLQNEHKDEPLDLSDSEPDLESSTEDADEIETAFEAEFAQGSMQVSEPQPEEFEIQDFAADEVAASEFTDEPQDVSESGALDESEAHPDVDDDAQYHQLESRIASTPLEELAPVELLERLAMSMARRRARTMAASTSDPEPTPIAAVETLDSDQAKAADPEPSDCRNPWSDLVPVAAAEPDDDERNSDDAGSADLPEDSAHEDFTAREENETSNEAAMNASQAFAAPRAVPAALRPVSFDVDGDDEELPGYVPPRSIGMMANAQPPAAFDASKDDGLDDDADDEGALEEGYSSLLNLSRPFDRQEFVRIDEPESDADDDVQPFVVFPGEQAGTRDDDTSHVQDIATSDDRPFDPPAIPDPRAEAEENERRLRAALANLQRISGAA